MCIHPYARGARAASTVESPDFQSPRGLRTGHLEVAAGHLEVAHAVHDRGSLRRPAPFFASLIDDDEAIKAFAA